MGFGFSITVIKPHNLYLQLYRYNIYTVIENIICKLKQHQGKINYYI